MNRKLHERFERLESKRAALINSLKNYSDETLSRQPEPGAWSVSEILHHLLTTEEASLRYLNKKIQGLSSSPSTGISNSVRIFVMRIVYSLPFRYKAPDVTLPANTNASIREIDERWGKVRVETINLLGKLSEEDLNRELWRHPIGGRMNIFQMIDFFEQHISRHEKQIGRTLEQTKK